MSQSAPGFVYLLQSLSNPKKHYIGFTVDLRNRLRQHNGMIAGGARRTHQHRPWQMVCYVQGFETRKEALQFEWTWQHVKKRAYSRERVLGKRNLGTYVKRKRNELDYFIHTHLSIVSVSELVTCPLE